MISSGIASARIARSGGMANGWNGRMAIDGRDECWATRHLVRIGIGFTVAGWDYHSATNRNPGHEPCGSPTGCRRHRPLPFGPNGSAGNAGIRHCPALPDLHGNLVFRHHPVAAANQMHQQGKHLRLQPDGLVAAPQFEAFGVQVGIRQKSISCGRIPQNRGNLHEIFMTQSSLSWT